MLCPSFCPSSSSSRGLFEICMLRIWKLEAEGENCCSDCGGVLGAPGAGFWREGGLDTPHWTEPVLAWMGPHTFMACERDVA